MGCRAVLQQHWLKRAPDLTRTRSDNKDFHWGDTKRGSSEEGEAYQELGFDALKFKQDEKRFISIFKRARKNEYRYSWNHFNIDKKSTRNHQFVVVKLAGVGRNQLEGTSEAGGWSLRKSINGESGRYAEATQETQIIEEMLKNKEGGWRNISKATGINQVCIAVGAKASERSLRPRWCRITSFCSLWWSERNNAL